MKNKKIRILIAEDSRTQAEQLGFMLEQHDYQVTIAANGKLALGAAQAQKPELILSDIVMPEMDGYELCKAVKSDEKLKDVPVILVTSLSDAQDVIRGLECGADNFIRKPYDEQYLISRIDYLLMNLELRKNQKMQMGMEIDLFGQKYFINSERQQILDLLISTYEQAVHINVELQQREKELAHSNEVLTGLYRIAEGLNRAASEQQVAELALERALELPGIVAGWVYLRDDESGLRLAATRNLSLAAGSWEGDCTCRQRLLSGELREAANMPECPLLARAEGGSMGLRSHASIPLQIDGRTLGILNLAGEEEGLFDDEALKVLHGVGKQVGVAMERARLHEHLEQLVEQRTAALSASEASLKLFRTLLDNSSDAIEVVEPDTLRFLDINETGCRVLDYSREELLSMSVFDIDPSVTPDSGKTIETEWRQSGQLRFESVHRRKDGSTFPVEVSAKFIELDKPYILSIVRNITQRKENEARIRRLNRIYAVLSGINTAIVRALEEGELFRQACRIAVEHGKFTFAWIGKFDADNMKVTPVARAGRDDGYLAQLLDTPEGIKGSCALTTQALTELKPVVCNDIASDDRMAAWRSEALSRGYRSVAVFPMMVELRPVGMFALYAPEEHAFDDEEMRLLLEMSVDINYALDNFSRETKRREAEDQLRKLSAAVEQSPNSIVITDLDAKLEYVNEAFVKVTGYSRAEAIGQNPSILHSGKNPRATYDDMWAHLTRGEVWKGELINRRKDGSEYVESVLISPVRDTDGRITHYLGIKEDITERKLAESRLAEQLDELRRWHEATLGREMRTMDLKREVNELLAQAGQPPRYPSAEEDKE